MRRLEEQQRASSTGLRPLSYDGARRPNKPRKPFAHLNLREKYLKKRASMLKPVVVREVWQIYMVFSINTRKRLNYMNLLENCSKRENI